MVSINGTLSGVGATNVCTKDTGAAAKHRFCLSYVETIATSTGDYIYTHITSCNDMIWYAMLWYEMIWYDMIWLIWYDMICNDAICCELSESVSTMKYHDSMALFRWSHLSPPEAIKCLAYHATLWLSLKLASFSAGELSSPQSCLSNSHLRQRALQTSQTSQTSSYSFQTCKHISHHITHLWMVTLAG